MRLLPTLLLLAGAALPAATIHVSNAGGDDARDGGAPERAVATFARAVALLRAGDTLAIAATGEPYRETLAIGRPLGSAAAPLVVAGNGAVISGLRRLDPARWQVEGRPGLWSYPVPPMASNCHPWLALDGRRVPAGDPAALAPGEHAWTAQRILYRPADGRSPAAMPLDATLGGNGVAITTSFVTVRDLTCQEHANDGFNLHGIARGVVLERVTGRDNGDDGCSIHEDCELTVRDSRFTGNDYGIEDVNASTSGYLGVLVQGNRVGVHLAGGWHRLVASTVAGNRETQVLVTPSHAAMHLGSGTDGLPFDGWCTIADSAIAGGATGLEIAPRSRAAVVQTAFSGSATAIAVRAGGALDLRLSRVDGRLVAVQGTYRGVRNAFDGTRFAWNGGEGGLAAFRAAGLGDLDSVEAPPGAQPFRPQGSTCLVGPTAILPETVP